MTAYSARDTLNCVGYEHLDISGDAGVRATGGSLEELFENAALGMYSLVTDPEGVREETTITVEAESDGPEGLLVNFLNELIFRLDTEGFVGKRVRVLRMGEETARAEIAGEEFDPERHEAGLLLKAATYHGLKVEERGGRWSADVIFDI